MKLRATVSFLSDTYEEELTIEELRDRFEEPDVDEDDQMTERQLIDCWRESIEEDWEHYCTPELDAVEVEKLS